MQLLGEGHDSMCSDARWKQKLAAATTSNSWGVLDIYSDQSDGEADGAGTPEASVQYGWMVGDTREHSLDTWAEGAARMGGLPEEMDSTRAEPMGAHAVLHTVREWEGTVRIWVDNVNVVRGRETRLGIKRAVAAWTRSEDWYGSALEGAAGCGIQWRPLGSSWPPAGENALQGGGQLDQGPCGQEDTKENGKQAPERECQSRCQLHSRGVRGAG